MLKATKHLLLPIGLSLLLLILPQMVLEPSAVGRGKLFPLFLSYTAHLSKEFPAGTTVGEVLDVLHNPEVVVRLFPIVLSVEPDTERGEHCYIITERLPLLGGLVNGKTTFKLKWTKSPNGYKGDVDASLGTKLLSEVRVNEDNGVVVVTEDLIVEVSKVPWYSEEYLG